MESLQDKLQSAINELQETLDRLILIFGDQRNMQK